MAQRRAYSGRRGSLTHRTSKDSTLDLKEKDRLGNILGKNISRVARDLGNTGGIPEDAEQFETIQGN